MTKFIGALLLLLPFVALCYFIVKVDGWKMFFLVWGIVLVSVACVMIGTFLLVIG